MSGARQTAAGRAVTEFILEVFRLNGRLLVAGDRLVAALGLTSARWQVLGAIAFAEMPQPVSWLARSMGLNRQGVQRLVNEMIEDGLLETQPNPHHRRAHLIVLTKRGRGAYEAATRLQAPWVNALAKGLAADEIAAALRVASVLRLRLEEDLKREDGSDEA